MIEPRLRIGISLSMLCLPLLGAGCQDQASSATRPAQDPQVSSEKPVMKLSQMAGARMHVALDEARSGAREEEESFVNTGDGLPTADRRARSGCRSAKLGQSAWLASRTHVPLALSRQAMVENAPPGCCASLAVKGSRWRAIGKHGQVVGEAKVAGGEGYDVSQCWELQLEQAKGKEGVGIFVGADDPWKPGPSMNWEPDKEQRAALVKFVEGVDQVVVDRSKIWAPWKKPVDLAARSLFFRYEEERAGGEGVAIGSRKKTTHRCAAVGGRYLVVACLGGEAGNQWFVRHLRNELVEQGHVGSYLPRAVVSMDDDPFPELIYHRDEGPSWADVVMDWRSGEDRAVSVGGGTL